MAILEAQGLVKRLGGSLVVDDVSLQVTAGQVLGLLGPNGAGKTTTIRMLYGFLRPDAGAIRFEDHDLGTDVSSAKRAIGVCTQDDTFDSDFTVRANLSVAASYFRPRVEHLDARIDELLSRFDLVRYANHKPDQLSGGYRRRLMIARALVHRPRVLFLDEPTTGLDPQARMSLWELIADLRRDGMGIVLTTHYMDEAERLADRMVVLQRGRVVADDAPRRVLGDLVGEHVVVIAATSLDDALRQWLNGRGIDPGAPILGELHLAMRSDDLAAFTAGFAACSFEVRKPTLDDLFVHLSREDEA